MKVLKKHILLTVSFAALAALIIFLRIQCVEKASNDVARIIPQGETANGESPAYTQPADLTSFEEWKKKNNAPLTSYDEYEYYESDMHKARSDGALARLTLRVVDSTGAPVPDANVSMYFVMFEKPENDVIGKTDENGMFTGEALSTWSVRWVVSKDGYYKTEEKYQIESGMPPKSAKDGRWFPWNPTIDVTLKEKRNPIDLKSVKKSVSFPIKQTVGFDFTVGDLVAPYGKGVKNDLFFLYDHEASLNPQSFSNHLIITSADGGGILTLPKDTFSPFKFVYEPPAKGWEEELSLNFVMKNDRVMQYNTLSKDKYWIVKTRDEDGNENYGVISEFTYGGSDLGTLYGRMTFLYVFNPNPNDANLEYEGSIYFESHP